MKGRGKGNRTYFSSLLPRRSKAITRVNSKPGNASPIASFEGRKVGGEEFCRLISGDLKLCACNVSTCIMFRLPLELKHGSTAKATKLNTESVFTKPMIGQA